MKEYVLKRVNGQPDWSAIPALQIDHQRRENKDNVTAQAQLCWDEEAIYLRMEAVEPDIRQEETDPLAEICKDSCLEFFLQPTDRVDYFNFEINPNRAIYLGFGPDLPNNIRQIVPEVQDLLDIQTAFTDGGWYVTYKVPFAFIRRFFPDFNPTKGTKVRANFYKCGDDTVKMHFLGWNPVEQEEPAFHVPKFFGQLIFGE